MLVETVVLCGEGQAEELGDLLMEAGAMSVTVEDADADSPDERPIFGEPGFEPETQAWRRSRLRVLSEEKFDAAAALAAAAAKLAGGDAPVIESAGPVPDADWVRITQAQFGPIRVVEGLWIVPTWHEPPERDAINIRLDPGVAFGTGSHPTTRLCLKWLAANVRKGDRVLDYGCGTGILAIAAAKAGAGFVTGVDIDPQAVEAAGANARENGVTGVFTTPEGLAEGRFDVVVANILSNPLRILAPALLGRVAPGGSLVLSGILERQAEEIIGIYRETDPGVELSAWAIEDGWACIAGARTR